MIPDAVNIHRKYQTKIKEPCRDDKNKRPKNREFKNLKSDFFSTDKRKIDEIKREIDE